MISLRPQRSLTCLLLLAAACAAPQAPAAIVCPEAGILCPQAGQDAAMQYERVVQTCLSDLLVSTGPTSSETPDRSDSDRLPPELHSPHAPIHGLTAPPGISAFSTSGPSASAIANAIVSLPESTLVTGLPGEAALVLSTGPPFERLRPA